MILKVATGTGFKFYGGVTKAHVIHEPDFQEPFSGQSFAVDNSEQRDLYITTETEKLAIRTNGDAYLLNDEGKTIDRI